MKDSWYKDRHFCYKVFLDFFLSSIILFPVFSNFRITTIPGKIMAFSIRYCFLIISSLLVLLGCGGGSGGSATASGGSSTLNEAQTSQKIIFAGDSAAGRGNWSSCFGFSIENRGVDGLESYQMVNSIEGIVASKPDKIFITIGGNNILNRHESILLNDISTIIDKILRTSPATIIYFHSILPCKYDLSNSLTEWYNSQIQVLCEHKGVKFLNIYSLLKDSKGISQKYFLADGIHLNDAGYQLWANTIRPLILS
jgi:hypothetical protein